VLIDHLAVVLPAYNEAEGIAGFVAELLEHLQPLADRVSVVVVDDRSTDDTARELRELGDPRVRVVTAERNRGHGPTALSAYRAGLELEPDVILHVDGDGQFLGADAAVVVAALDGSTDAVHGVRRGRSDPWFRRALTGGVRSLVAAVTGRGVSDVNTPLRAYRPAVLRELLEAAPEEALVPHVHFSLAESRRRLRVREIEVSSIPRRGAEATGTMWGQQRGSLRLPPSRLVDFSRSAAGEVWRHSVRPALTPSAVLALVALGLVAVAHAVVVTRSMALPLWEDEAFNLTVPLNLVRGLGYVSDGILSFGELAPFDPRISTGPVMLLPVAALLGLGADPVIAGRVVALLFYAVLLIALLVLGRRVGGSWGGVAAVIVPLLLDLDALPSPLQGPTDLLGEVPTAALLVLALLTLRRRPLLSAVLFGLAVQVKFIALLVSPVFLIAAIVLAPEGRRVRGGVLYVALAAAPSALYEFVALVSMGYPEYRERLSLMRWFLTSGGQEGLGVDAGVKLATLATSTSLPWVVAVLAFAVVVALVAFRARSDRPAEVLVAAAGLALYLVWWVGSSHLPAWVRHPSPALLAFLPVVVAFAVGGLRSIRPRALAVAAAVALGIVGLWGGAARVTDALLEDDGSALSAQRETAARLAELDAPWITTRWGGAVSLVVLSGAHVGVEDVHPEAPRVAYGDEPGCEPIGSGVSLCE
jgi:hypothetical protein